MNVGCIKSMVEAIQISLGAVYKKEYRLIEQHCHEVNIVGAFYHYFRQLFELRFESYCIDMEYCRMGTRTLSKEININVGGVVCPLCNKKHTRRIRSDFIIHRPGTDDNLLVIEFKGEWSSGCLDWDEKKLCALTMPLVTRPAEESYVCGYKLGVSIMLKEDMVGLEQFEEGNKVGEVIKTPKECLVRKYELFMKDKKGGMELRAIQGKHLRKHLG